MELFRVGDRRYDDAGREHIDCARYLLTRRRISYDRIHQAVKRGIAIGMLRIGTFAKAYWFNDRGKNIQSLRITLE